MENHVAWKLINIFCKICSTIHIQSTKLYCRNDPAAVFHLYVVFCLIRHVIMRLCVGWGVMVSARVCVCVAWSRSACSDTLCCWCQQKRCLWPFLITVTPHCQAQGVQSKPPLRHTVAKLLHTKILVCLQLNTSLEPRQQVIFIYLFILDLISKTI